MGLRKTFFHNGAVSTFRQAIEFYIERDTAPEKWYPRGPDGGIVKFDDLPAQYHDNINKEPPFGGKPGDRPILTAADIDDIVAFLKTLTDGYRPTSEGTSEPSRR